MNDIIFTLLSVVILYAWAGVCFLIFRYSRPEADSRMRHFLRSHHKFFASRAVGFWGHRVVSQRDATRKMIKQAGLRGWIFFAPTLFNSWAGSNGYPACLLSIAMLFFGGLMFAYSWYGLRCLRLLGLDSYAEQT